MFKKLPALSAAFLAANVAHSDPAFAKECTVGGASWYSRESSSPRTASGEPMVDSKMTAAHKTLPFGEKASVTNLKTGKEIVVRINDRGPFIKGRIIDLTPAAARKLGIKGAGHGQVMVCPL